MKTNTLIKQVKENVLDALISEKESLIVKFYFILKKYSELLNSKQLGFWEKQIEDNKWELISTTKIGVKQELLRWQNYEPSLESLLYYLQDTSENILSYWFDDDLCNRQGQ